MSKTRTFPTLQKGCYRLFTLNQDDLDFNERSDSVTVLESLSSSRGINLFVCCVNKPSGSSFTSLSVLASALHQISTFEDTILRHHSILSSLMFTQSTSSDVFDFYI